VLQENNMQGASRLAVIIVPFAIACSHPETSTGPTTTRPFANSAVAAKPVSPNLAVSGELDSLCALRFNDHGKAPKFDFDRFQLLEADRDVLDQVATCLTAGPLKGKKVQLVGRADPRGTEEYNLALGDIRAMEVVRYLLEVGVDDAQLAVLTRGELDATGRDDRSWQLDRRVDLQLMN
jgi:peptidoglycan-associated lipoprotein